MVEQTDVLVVVVVVRAVRTVVVVREVEITVNELVDDR